MSLAATIAMDTIPNATTTSSSASCGHGTIGERMEPKNVKFVAYCDGYIWMGWM